jgi:hypothetical protein
MKKSSAPPVGSKPKRPRGRPQGTKRTTTLGGIERAQNRDGELRHFIEQHMAADPKPFGRKARAYRAASEKFGGLARTTIDRRLEAMNKAQPLLAEVRSNLQQGMTDQNALLQRMRAAFTADDWAEINSLPYPVLMRLLEDREATILAKRSKKNRRN